MTATKSCIVSPLNCVVNSAYNISMFLAGDNKHYCCLDIMFMFLVSLGPKFSECWSVGRTQEVNTFYHLMMFFGVINQLGPRKLMFSKRLIVGFERCHVQC
jgi:hypothetical protein